MKPFSRNGHVAQASTTNPNPDNGLLFRIAAYAAAVALIACAAAQNTAYGWQLGSAKSELSGYILAGGALAAAIMAPICLTVAFSGRGFLVRIAAVFLGAWCLCYGVTASLGFVSSSREAMNAERLAAIDARAQAKTRHDAAADELEQLSAGKASPATTKRSAELQKVMADAAVAMKAEKAVAVADPQSAALAHYLAAAGYKVSPESVATWTTAFTTAFYEVAGAFALAVARASGGSPAATLPGPSPTPSPPAEAPVAPPQPRAQAKGDDRDDRSDDPPPPPPRKRGKAGPGRPANVLPAEVVDKLRKRGGKAAGSLNGIGRLIGSKSKTATHRLLHRCAELGLLRLTTGRDGVRVAVV